MKQGSKELSPRPLVNAPKTFDSKKPLTCLNLFKLVQTSYCTAWCNIRYELIQFLTCLNLFKLVQNYNMTKFYWIWCNSTQLICPDLSKCNDMIYNDSTNMFRLVIMLWYDLIRFYDTIWYGSTNMSKLVQN